MFIFIITVYGFEMMTNIPLRNKDTRTKIHQLISSIFPYDNLEQEHISDALLWIESDAPIFLTKKPDIPNKHLVSYFVLFDDVHKKVLLVDHKKALLWLPAGGHVEINEDPKATVERECLEELGIEADFWSPNPIFISSTLTVGLTAGHTDVSLGYLLKGDSNCTTYNFDFEKNAFNDVLWFRFDNVPYEKSDPHMLRFIEKLKSIKKWL